MLHSLIALKPRVVHIMAGTNDIAGNTGPTTPEAYKNAVRAMVALAEANGIVVILASIPFALAAALSSFLAGAGAWASPDGVPPPPAASLRQRRPACRETGR